MRSRCERSAPLCSAAPLADLAEAATAAGSPAHLESLGGRARAEGTPLSQMSTT